MELDLVTRWMLWFFGSLALGGALGFVQAYRELSYDPRRLVGTVVAVEERAANASGSITAPVAIVE